MIKTVNSYYHHNYLFDDDRETYGFLASDIYTSVASGIKTETQMKKDRENDDEFTYLMESLNIWLGESEDSLFSYEMFSHQQTLTTGFMPSEAFEEFKGNKNKNRTNVLAMDIAVSSGVENDNTVYSLGYYDSKTKKSGVEYIKAYNGLNSIKQVVLLKRLFYDYGCSYAVIDTKGRLMPPYIVIYK